MSRYYLGQFSNYHIKELLFLVMILALISCNDQGKAPEGFVNPLSYEDTPEQKKKVEKYIDSTSIDDTKDDKPVDFFLKGLQKSYFVRLISDDIDKDLLRQVIEYTCFKKGRCTYMDIHISYSSKVEKKKRQQTD